MNGNDLLIFNSIGHNLRSSISKNICAGLEIESSVIVRRREQGFRAEAVKDSDLFTDVFIFLLKFAEIVFCA